MNLQILSDGTVSLNGTRITKRKMHGISTVLEEFNVDKKAIENIINEEYGSGYCNWKSNYEIMEEGNVVFDIQCREDNGLKRGSIPNNFTYGSFKYCPFCGRKIKWL